MNVSFVTLANAIVTQAFGNYNPALYGGDRLHKGIDYGVMPNNPVYACMDGTVQTAINQQTGYGRHIRVLHGDGSLSIYGHLNRLLVASGDTVKAGQEIGKSGGDPRDGVDGDGLSTGAHLHWEIRPPHLHQSDQTAVDPMKWCLQYLPGRFEVAEVTAFNGLNVRSAPIATSTRLWAAKRKEVLQIVEKSNGWARIHSLRDEWVSMQYLFFTGEVIEVGQPETPDVDLTMEEKVDILWGAHPELH
jgi:hypothetical protein